MDDVVISRASRWPVKEVLGAVVALLVALTLVTLPLATSAGSAAIYRGYVRTSVTLFGLDQAPAVAATDDSTPMEVGVRFSSDTVARVTGLRFYRGAGNEGPHVGSLWDATGRRVGVLDFEPGTATGWQLGSFATPVTIAADTVYTASYFAPAGHVAMTPNYFTTAARTPPLRSRGGVQAGVRHLGISTFPTEAETGVNYWVDVLIAPNPPAATPSTPAVLTPTTPSPAPTPVTAEPVLSSTGSAGQ